MQVMCKQTVINKHEVLTIVQGVVVKLFVYNSSVLIKV